MSGVRRALLIGSQTGKLMGVDADVERMADALSRQLFTELTIRTGAKATRDGILGAYDELIEEARQDDTVCVYYSGHGNLAPNPHYQPGKRTPPVLQYLIPTDDGPGEFRGVMSFELSQRLARLTRQTRNVTVILDCCHSARMSRAALDAGLVAKGGTARVDDQKLAELLRQSYPDEALLDVESNPYAVRLVAAEAHSLAFERRLGANEATGAFTEALLQALSEIGADRVSWNALTLRARELVMARIPEQRPDAEGPRRRRIWGLEEVPDERALALYFERDQPRLRGGVVLGVVPGASYGVMPAGAEAYARERSLGTAVVEECLGSVARVRLDSPHPAALPRTGLLAFPLDAPFGKREVALDRRAPAELRTRLAASRFLRPVDPGGDPSPGVTIEDDALVVRDALGELLLRAPATNLEAVIAVLERLARAEDLRRLEAGTLDAGLVVSFGRIVNGQAQPMEEGETLYAGDRQFIRVQNDGFAPVYVAVLGIDPAYDVQLISRRSPRGHRLAQRERLIVGENTLGSVPGVAVSWPESLPPDRPRRESLIVIAADAEQDFSLLTTGTRSRGGSPSALERRLDQIRGGTARSRGASDARSAYAVYRIDYQLAPSPRGGVYPIPLNPST